jgi:hypothetical protein
MNITVQMFYLICFTMQLNQFHNFRTELVGDLGYQLTFSIFDEASVSEWKGRDLRLANELPNMDLIVLPVRQVRN